jgi:hypothetical protein
MTKKKKKAMTARPKCAVPTLPHSVDGIGKESLALARVVFPKMLADPRGTLKVRVLAALAVVGNNADHRKVATMVGSFHKAATAKGCSVCREEMGKEYRERKCYGSHGTTRWVVSIVGDAVKVAPRGSRADRVGNLFAWWVSNLPPQDREAAWKVCGENLRR